MNFRNLGAYLQERFAPVNMGLFVVLFFTVRGITTLACAQNRCSPPPDGPWLTVLGALATVSFFFRLRVFDEEKDFAQDAVNHPQRVLQTGRVTLPQLRTTISQAIDPSRITWIVVGEAAKVKPQLDTLGMPVEVVTASSLGLPAAPAPAPATAK